MGLASEVGVCLWGWHQSKGFVCGAGIRGGFFFVCGVGIRGGGLSVEMVSEVGFLAVGEVQTEERGGDSRRGSTLLL